ncbi:MAG TPA: hypothetical protein PK890_01005 [Terrimesophilobacter sp.]|nr:hypothetical protein [Terrimesophilobacter sp.]
MNSSRLWTIGATLLIFALLAGTWFLGVAPRLTDARDANAAQTSARSMNDPHRATLAALQADHERMDEIQQELAEIQVAIPEYPEVSRFVAELATIATSTGVQVGTLTIGEPLSYIPPILSDPAATETAGTLATSGLYVVPVSVNVLGTHQSALNFVAALQQGHRLLLAHNVAIAESEEGTTVTIQAQIFGLSTETIPEPEAPAPAEQ